MARRLLIGLLLAAAILGVYAQVLDFDFVSWDDPLYVSHNPQVAGGLSLEGLRAAFTEPAVYWHPLVTLSHMLDVELFGMDPGAHHRTNLILHLLNTWLLFLWLELLTAAPWRSALVAALFAVHPLHVEAVAWISSRKDLVSTGFGLLSLLGYLAWARRGSRLGYGLAGLALALGLMAKPMLVTWPALFLLLDYWPLGRLQALRAWASSRSLLLEKLPFLGIALASSALTMGIQRGTELLGSIGDVSRSAQLANAVVSYVRYLAKTLWPSRLSVLYPHPDLPGGTPWSALQVAAAFGLLLLLSLLVLHWRRHRYLTVGWLWFLGSLVPVIGLVKFGNQAMADRFTYVPHIGLFLGLVWAAAELAGDSRRRRALLASASLGLLVAYAAAAREQTANWRDSISLYESSLRAAPNPPVLRYNLANLLFREGRIAEAVHHYQEALAEAPDYASAHNNLATALLRLGQPEPAEQHFREVLRIQPTHPRAHFHLAELARARGELEAAIAHYEAALAARPQHGPTRQGLARARAEARARERATP